MSRQPDRQTDRQSILPNMDLFFPQNTQNNGKQPSKLASFQSPISYPISRKTVGMFTNGWKKRKNTQFEKIGVAVWLTCFSKLELI